MQQERGYPFFLLLIFFLLTGMTMAVAVGLRPVAVGTDTIHYIERFQYFVDYRFNVVNYEWLVGSLALFSAGFTDSPRLFFTLLAGVNILLIGFLAKQLARLPKMELSWQMLFLGLSMGFFISPFFFAVMVNIIRCGPALLLVYLLYIGLIHRKNLWQIPLLIGLIFGFHSASLLMIVFAPAIFLRMRYIVGLTMISCFLYLSGIGQWIIEAVSGLSGVDLYTKIIGYPDYADPTTWHIRIRWDFAIFSLAMGAGAQIWAWFLLVEAEQKAFLSLTKIYWILTWPFFLFGFGAYSDRYIYPAWLFLSVLSGMFVLIYCRRFKHTIFWLLSGYTISFLYFLLRVQGYTLRI